MLCFVMDTLVNTSRIVLLMSGVDRTNVQTIGFRLFYFTYSHVICNQKLRKTYKSQLRQSFVLNYVKELELKFGVIIVIEILEGK
jgi:hypothetical protein